MRPDEVNNNIRRVMAQLAEYRDSGRIIPMTLSDDVAELERRCAAAEQRVEEMIDDPVISYADIELSDDDEGASRSTMRLRTGRGTINPLVASA